MLKLELQSVTRERGPRTTIPNDAVAEAADLVQRDFTATRPNRRWVADLPYVATWSGVVYAAFVIDAYSRKTVGWRLSRPLRNDVALDALEQALVRPWCVARAGAPQRPGCAVRVDPAHRAVSRSGHRAFGGQLRPFLRNALAESIIALYKMEVIRTTDRGGAWSMWSSRHSTGGLVQQPATAGTNRGHSSHRGRGATLREAEGSGDGRRTQAMKPPEKPDRSALTDSFNVDRRSSERSPLRPAQP